MLTCDIEADAKDNRVELVGKARHTSATELSYELELTKRAPSGTVSSRQSGDVGAVPGEAVVLSRIAVDRDRDTSYEAVLTVRDGNGEKVACRKEASG